MATTAIRPVVTPTASVRVFAEEAAASACRARCVCTASSWPSVRRTLGSAADSWETAFLSRAAVVPAAARSRLNRTPYLMFAAVACKRSRVSMGV